MDDLLSRGGLIPLWILGAPLLGALVMWMASPKHTRSENRDHRDSNVGVVKRDVRASPTVGTPLPTTAPNTPRM